MYTVSEIVNAVMEDWDDSWSEFLEMTDYVDGVELESLGEIARQADEGGEKHPWVVFKVGSQFFRMHGSHDSWEGTDWDGSLQEVEPFTKTVVDYRAKK